MKRTQYQPSNRRGFTIIEVVLVLAIAGLIFLMVFIALPNMQSAQRNTQRRNDYNSLSTQITNYVANHNGAIPTSIKKTWFNSTGNDPDGNVYNATVTPDVDDGTANLSQDGKNGKYQAIVYIDSTNGYDCGDSGDVRKLTGNPKKFVIKGYIEAGGSNGDFICIESHI